MALSYQWPTQYITQYGDAYGFYTKWVATQNYYNIQSTITAQVVFVNKYQNYLNLGGGYWYIDGGNEAWTSALGAGTHAPGSYVVATKTWTYTHDDLGAKTFKFGARAGQGSIDVTFTTQTFTLDTIARGKVYIRAATSAGAPSVGQVYIGNASGTPLFAKAVYIGDANGTPRLWKG